MTHHISDFAQQHAEWSSAAITRGCWRPGVGVMHLVGPSLLGAHELSMPQRQAEQEERGADSAGVLRQRAAEADREQDVEQPHHDRPGQRQLLCSHLHL